MRTRILLTSSLTLICLLSTACLQQPGSSPRTAGAQPTSGSGQTSGPALADGTVSGAGGGNGIDGKAIETYSVKIESLPEYVMYIAPIMRRLSRGTPDVLTSYLNWSLKNKVWYLVPKDLDLLPRERIALAFASDQLALHSDREIFISKVPYEKKTNREKAYLLLHEMVMAAKLLMKKTPEEQCKALKGADAVDCENPEMMELARAVSLSPDERKILNGDDHESVRSMTVFLMEQNQDLSGTSVRAIRQQLGFPYPWDSIASNINSYDVLESFVRSSIAGDIFRERSAQANSDLRYCYFKPHDYVSAMQFSFIADQLDPKNSEMVVPEPSGYGASEIAWGGTYFKLPAHDSGTTLIIGDGHMTVSGLLNPFMPGKIADAVRFSALIHPTAVEQLLSQNHGRHPNYITYQLNVLLTRESQPRVMEYQLTPMRLVIKRGTSYEELPQYEFVRAQNLEPIRCLNHSLIPQGARTATPAIPAASAATAAPPVVPTQQPSNSVPDTP